MKQWLNILCTILLFASCTPDTECRQEENVRCLCVFAEGQSLTGITVQGLGVDSLLIKAEQTVDKLALPLRTDTNCSQFIITGGEKQDILTIFHTPQPYFVSMACGCFVFHTIDSVATQSTIFTKPEIINTAVQNIEEKNVQLTIIAP